MFRFAKRKTNSTISWVHAHIQQTEFRPTSSLCACIGCVTVSMLSEGDHNARGTPPRIGGLDWKAPVGNLLI